MRYMFTLVSAGYQLNYRLIKYAFLPKHLIGDNNVMAVETKLSRAIIIKSNLSGPCKHMAVTYASFCFSNLADLNDLVS